MENLVLSRAPMGHRSSPRVISPGSQQVLVIKGELDIGHMSRVSIVLLVRSLRVKKLSTSHDNIYS